MKGNIIDQILAVRASNGFVNDFAALIPKRKSELGWSCALYLIGPSEVVLASEKSSNRDYLARARNNMYHYSIEYFSDTIIIVHNHILDRNEIWVDSSKGPIEIGWKLKHTKEDFDFNCNVISKALNIFEVIFPISKSRYIVNYRGKHTSIKLSDRISIYEDRIIIDSLGGSKAVYSIELKELK